MTTPWRTPKRKKLERHVEENCKRWARERGWRVRKFKSPGMRSEPDDIFLKDGRHVYVEFKKPGEKPTKLQLECHADIRAHGGEVYVFDNEAAFKGTFTHIECEMKAGIEDWLV